MEDIVLSGYRLPFVSYPDPVVMRNHPSTLVEEFVSAEIDSLVAASCVIESCECPCVCSPLLVVCNSKGKRSLVLDLRVVNQFLPKWKFKYEALNLFLICVIEVISSSLLI